MGKSGYFAKKVMLSVSGIYLCKDESPCNTVNPIVYEIKTKKHLQRLSGRMYRTPNARVYDVLKGNETQLIGTRIFVKSPITCACESGICKHCYGPLLYHTNRDGVGIGSYAGAIITNPINQSILSTKHLLTTTSEIIEFDDNFNAYFTLDANEISISSTLDNQQDYSLLIIHKNIVTLEELSEGEINEFVSIFHVKNNKTGEIVEIMEKNMKEMYISPELRKLIKLGKKHRDIYEINFMDIPDDCGLFLIQIANSELTKPLYNIMGLLDSKKKHEELGVRTISDAAQNMLDLLIESNINSQAVHGELLIYPLIRSKDDILERPDFSKYMASDRSQILTLASALEKHPSPLVGLSSSYLSRQLRSPLTFKKCGTSVVDPFFKPTL